MQNDTLLADLAYVSLIEENGILLNKDDINQALQDYR